jgi:protein SCO1/2
LLFGLVASMACAAFGQFDQAAVPPGAMSKDPRLSKIRVVQRPGVQLPMDTPFKDEAGKSVVLGDYFGKRPVLLLPIFYNCTGVCTVELQGILGALRGMKSMTVGKDLDVVVSVVGEYGRPQSAPGWHFLTGDERNIHAVTDPLGFYFLDDPKNDWVDHPSGVMVLTPHGIVSRYFVGITYNPKTLQAEVARAGKDEIGKVTTDQFFGCVHLDPITGKRSIVIQNVLRLGGIVTILALILGIASMSIRRKREAA